MERKIAQKNYRAGVSRFGRRLVPTNVKRFIGRPAREHYQDLLWRLNRTPGTDGVLKKKVFGREMCVNPRDVGISKELTVYKIHEPHVTSWLRSYLRPGMVVIEVGANIGYYALQEADLIGPQGTVIAIEPAPENLAFLIKNIQSNHCTNVEIISSAVGDKNGFSTLFLTERSNHHSLINGHQASAPAGALRVPVLTLDSLIEQDMTRVDLVRMDVEGYEDAVFAGMSQILEAYRPSLLMELHPRQVGAHRTIALVEKLAAAGYQLGNFRYREMDWPWTAHKEPVRKSWFCPPETIHELASQNYLTGRRIKAFNALFVHESKVYSRGNSH